jgi:hypothetical protein
MTDKLKGRVKLYSTIYRTTGKDKDGRGWIVIDKKEVFSACTTKWVKERWISDRFKGMDYCDANKELEDEGIIQQYEFYNAFEEYLRLSIEEIQNSENILIRALSMIDRRTGKRYLEKIKVEEGEHDIIKLLYTLQCDVDGIKSKIL